MIPCLLVGAVEGLSRLLRWAALPVRRDIPRRRLQLAAAVLILMASLPYPCYVSLSGRARGRDATAHRDFDSACAWLIRHGDRPGPILTRHPGEVFLATGRQALEVSTSERPGDPDATPEAIDRTIDRYNVAYLLIDQDRYLKAPPVRSTDSPPSGRSEFARSGAAKAKRRGWPSMRSCGSGGRRRSSRELTDGRRRSVAGPSNRSLP